ncbi:MAG: 6-carboxytetrahydropterin synthase [Acidobacteriota bacterium]|nr:6-carboxytetrahydropterin synthase [Acidobacteriota bacterium]
MSEDENAALYGKCNNPFGHGHNYDLEVSVRGPVDPVTGRAVDGGKLDGLIQAEVIERFHHRSLNAEIPRFADVVPTTENLGLEIYETLKAGWPAAFPEPWPVLDAVRIAETPRNIFEVTDTR